VRDELLAAAAARRGHFLLESGHHGDLWLDLDRLFTRPAQVLRWSDSLTARLVADDLGVTAVCGPMIGGAFLAQFVAARLGVGAYYTERDASTAPAVGYRLPGSLRAELAGQRTVVVDDVVNAASAVRKTLAELAAAGARPVALAALLTLGPAAADLAAERGLVFRVLATAASNLWTQDECPLCASGTPLAPPDGP
jgi:orotate phosphoribosyltransferase